MVGFHLCRLHLTQGLIRFILAGKLSFASVCHANGHDRSVGFGLVTVAWDDMLVMLYRNIPPRGWGDFGLGNFRGRISSFREDGEIFVPQNVGVLVDIFLADCAEYHFVASSGGCARGGVCFTPRSSSKEQQQGVAARSSSKEQQQGAVARSSSKEQ